MTIYKAVDLRPKFAGRVVATIEPVTKHRRANRKWEIFWTAGRAPEAFELLSDAMGFVRRFYPEVEFKTEVTKEAA